jgi:tRNA(Ile)-lysidine synthase
MAAPSPEQVQRFRDDLAAAAGDVPDRLGLAISGGPDSLALLLLAAAALPGRTAAATVDHGLRAEAAAEARLAADICAELGVPHVVLRPGWAEPPDANVQAAAREARYAALAGWAEAQAIGVVATGHHADDQAETLLMRLARGAGLSGLAGVRPARPIGGAVLLVRPLLGWRRDELAGIVRRSGIQAADDPANRDPRYDRTHVRALLGSAGWLDPRRLAAAAANLGEAEAALDWCAGKLWDERAREAGHGLLLDTSGLPRELQRRLLMKAIARLGGAEPPGPKLIRLLDDLEAGRPGTLAGLTIRPGAEGWSLAPAPPRRRRASGAARQAP